MTPLEQELAHESIESIVALMGNVGLCKDHIQVRSLDVLGDDSTRSLLLGIAQELHGIGAALSVNAHYRGYMDYPMRLLTKGVTRLQDTSKKMGHGLDNKSVPEVVAELFSRFYTYEQLDEISKQIDDGQFTVKGFVRKLTHFT